MYGCESIAQDGSCEQWVEIANWSHLPVDGAVEIAGAIGVLWAIAFGFNLLARFILGRK
ncbi:hypothetical protein H0Z60_12895 [Ectothiorhodospiraceae bacterium WFHF3C12]|nr:hypothetical protein [Ectothiorhodospiraceae bacterium WFHF3C12]